MLRLLPDGSRIHLVTLEKGRSMPDRSEIHPGIVLHPLSYERFGVKGIVVIAVSILRLCWSILKNGIDTIHAWCTPAGAIGYFLSVLTGRPLIIDSYEPHAEAMVENGTWPKGGVAHRLLFTLERLQSHRAKHLIAAASGMTAYAQARYGLPERHIHVKPACVDLQLFSEKNIKRAELLEKYGLEGKLIAVYAGKFGGIYMDQEVFDLLRVARDHWGERFHVLLLTGHSQKELLPFIVRAGLDKAMFTIMKVPHEEIPDHIGLGDLALTPVKPVPTKRLCTPIKDGEYWALGLPVIISDGISDDSDIIRDHGIGSVLSRYDTVEYKRAVLEIDALLIKYSREECYQMIRPIAERYRNFDRAERIYKEIYGGKG